MLERGPSPAGARPAAVSAHSALLAACLNDCSFARLIHRKDSCPHCFTQVFKHNFILQSLPILLPVRTVNILPTYPTCRLPRNVTGQRELLTNCVEPPGGVKGGGLGVQVEGIELL